MTTCTATAESNSEPGHIHTCTGINSHIDGDHFCPECRRWWFVRN